VGIPVDKLLKAWQDRHERLDDRIKSYVENISLLRISAEDAKRDAKRWANCSDGDDTVDMTYGHGDDAGPDDDDDKQTSPTMLQSYGAFLESLSSAVQPDSATAGSRELKELWYEAKEAAPDGEDEGFVCRPSDFYAQLQETQQSPLHALGPLSKADISAAWKSQKAMNAKIVSAIEGQDQDLTHTPTNGDTAVIPAGSIRGTPKVGPGGTIELEIGPCTTYADVAYRVGVAWNLNKLQMLAVLLPCQFLDKHGNSNPQESADQHLQYIGGEGGTGKSRVVDALKDIFRVKGQLHQILVTASSGSAAAKIGGITIHSACGLGVDESGGRMRQSKAALNPSEETRWRWGQKIFLILDEISMVGGSTLHEVNERLQLLRGDKRPFGGIPVVLFTGDFYQFSPVAQTSLLIGMEDMEWNSKSQRAFDSVQRHQRGYYLFKRFSKVVILQEQVRARGCAKLRSFLGRLRAGEQTEEDFSSLQQRFIGDQRLSFADGLRAITPLNRNRWHLIMAAVLEWGWANQKHISIFISTHIWEGESVGQAEMMETLGYGDDSKVHAPGVFFYTQGMPVVLTRNVLPGLKMVNGAEFDAVDVIPDPAFPGYHMADDVTIHFGPPYALVLASDETRNLAIFGMPTGTVLLRPTSAMPMRPDQFRFLQSPCRRGGIAATAAFAMTDYKAQSRTFEKLMLELRGKQQLTTGPSKCEFMSLYVQLSRATHWEGISLCSIPRRKDFIDPINQLDPKLRKGLAELESVASRTRRDFEEGGLASSSDASWFQGWLSMPETQSP